MEEEITINNVKYFSEARMQKDLEEVSLKLKKLNEKMSSDRKPAKRFSESHTLSLIKSLSKMFNIETASINEDYVIEKGVVVIDPANVLLVTGKSEEAKRLLTMFKSFEIEDKPEPVLDYKIEGIARCKFSLEYFEKIIDVLKITDEALTITNAIDYPITIENKDFKFILAPRVESGE